MSSQKYTYTPAEQALIDKNMNSPELRREWKLPPNETGARIMFVLFIIAMVASYGYTIWYLIMGDIGQVSTGTTGFCIVISLSVISSALRFFQARLLTKDTDELAEIYEENFTGEPGHDQNIQGQIDERFQFRCRKLNAAGWMIVIAMAIIEMINLQQGSIDDLTRSMIYTGTLAVFACGYLWHMFLFNAKVIYTAMLERVKAAVRWHTEHPDFPGQSSAL